mmetsp:Transcript_18850/g.56176  ORF Transcript_18850/g.56176 Transcript_18850/m.56176 type:complete len:206 (-) Transcript_18850:531-1148(-)
MGDAPRMRHRLGETEKPYKLIRSLPVPTVWNPTQLGLTCMKTNWRRVRLWDGVGLIHTCAPVVAGLHCCVAFAAGCASAGAAGRSLPVASACGNCRLGRLPYGWCGTAYGQGLAHGRCDRWWMLEGAAARVASGLLRSSFGVAAEPHLEALFGHTLGRCVVTLSDVVWPHSLTLCGHTVRQVWSPRGASWGHSVRRCGPHRGAMR